MANGGRDVGPTTIFHEIDVEIMGAWLLEMRDADACLQPDWISGQFKLYVKDQTGRMKRVKRIFMEFENSEAPTNERRVE